jgi:hypothetical protein
VSLVYIASAKPATVREKIKEFKALFFPERVVYTFSLGIYHAAEVWQISGYCTFKQR